MHCNVLHAISAIFLLCFGIRLDLYENDLNEMIFVIFRLSQVLLLINTLVKVLVSSEKCLRLPEIMNHALYLWMKLMP